MNRPRAGRVLSGVMALVGALLLSAAVVQGQAQCGDFARQALAAAGSNCSGQTRNTACYGHNGVSASFSTTVDSAYFTRPADIADVEQLARLVTLPFDATSDTWGVAVLNLQANLPGNLPGQAVTLLLVGDVALQNQGSMTAFQVTTGLGTPNCTQLPPSSLTVQSPRSARVALNVNGADFSIGSTASFVAENPRQMRVLTIEGRIVVDGSTIIPRGFSRTVDLDENGDIVPDSWSDPEVLTEDQRDALEFISEVPDTIFADTVTPPDDETLAMLGQLDFDLVAGFDPYLLADMLALLQAQGLTADDLAGVTLDDLAAYALENLDALGIDEDRLAALALTFGLSDDDVRDLAEAYGLDLDAVTERISSEEDWSSGLSGDDGPSQDAGNDSSSTSGDQGGSDDTVTDDSGGSQSGGSGDAGGSSEDSGSGDSSGDASGGDAGGEGGG